MDFRIVLGQIANPALNDSPLLFGGPSSWKSASSMNVINIVVGNLVERLSATENVQEGGQNGKNRSY